eukprot:5429821-Amphidinium_carterae.1
MLPQGFGLSNADVYTDAEEAAVALTRTVHIRRSDQELETAVNTVSRTVIQGRCQDPRIEFSFGKTLCSRRKWRYAK